MYFIPSRLARPAALAAVVLGGIVATSPSASAADPRLPPCEPSAVDDFYFTTQDVQLDVPASGYLINDELCGNGVSFGAASSGTFILGGAGAFSFVPEAGFTGDVTIPYTIDETEVSATINIYVAPLPCIVDLADDDYETALDTPLAVAAPGVAANDPELCENPLELVSTTANGTLAFNGDGSFDYTPNAGFTGVDTFTYTVEQIQPPTLRRAGFRAPAGAPLEVATVTILISAPTTTTTTPATTSTTVVDPTTTIVASSTSVPPPPTLPATR